jgi:hypothetical protein
VFFRSSILIRAFTQDRIHQGPTAANGRTRDVALPAGNAANTGRRGLISIRWGRVVRPSRSSIGDRSGRINTGAHGVCDALARRSRNDEVDNAGPGRQRARNAQMDSGPVDRASLIPARSSYTVRAL